MERYLAERDSILIVDDVKLNRDILSKMFTDRYEVLQASNGLEAIQLAERNIDRIAAVLLDVVMPKMDGIAVVKSMREKGWMILMPVLLITTESTRDIVTEGARLGVTDVIAKPFAPDVVLGRVANAIELFQYRQNVLNHKSIRAAELQMDQKQMLHTLRGILERDDCLYSGNAVHIQFIVRLLLSAVMQRHPEYRLTPETVDYAVEACFLYDIGKLTLPTSLLDNPTHLSSLERTRMKEYPARGCVLLERFCPFLEEPCRTFAHDICLHHHERFTGRGYPDGLRGDEISIWAQAVGLADAYEALVCKRPYRKAFTHREAFELIEKEKCGVFNPALVDSLRVILPQLYNYVYKIEM